MTPKQRYDERKRLRAERLHRAETMAADRRQRDEDVQEQVLRVMTAFERIADVLELWADMQGETK